MKPFNLEKALAGKPVVTRDGRKVTQLHVFEANGTDFPIATVIDGRIEFYSKEGRYTFAPSHKNDLFMASEKVTKWINVYNHNSHNHNTYFGVSNCYETEQDANTCRGPNCVATLPITFEI